MRTNRLPPARKAAALFAGDFLALLVWEVFARFRTPLVVGGPLEPAALIIGLTNTLFGFGPPRLLAEAIHYATGTVFYPLGFWMLSRTISINTLVDGLAWGVITFLLALGVFATMAGLPFMLGCIPLTWMSGIAHVIYGVLAVALYELLGRRAFAGRTAVTA